MKNLAILAEIDTQKLPISDTLRIFEERVGAKNYELSNHLANVLATISDKTIFNTDHYNGIVYSAQLYYPFGWEIPTLSYAAKKYRFGFNGKEDDREWHAQDYGFRLYTPREGRFISVDPITAEYPELTPYQFASNTPIQAVDLDGLEAFIISKNMKNLPLGEPVIQLVQTTSLYKEFDIVLKKNKKYDVFLLPINMDDKNRLFFTSQNTNYVGFPIFSGASAHGFTSVFTDINKMSLQYGKYFDISEVNTTFDSNKKLIVIAFDGRILNPLRYMSDEEKTLIFNFGGHSFLPHKLYPKLPNLSNKFYRNLMISSAETIIHEFYAHGLVELKGKKRDPRQEHIEYGCSDEVDAFYSISIKTIYETKHNKSDDEKNKFNRTPFGKSIQELEKNVDNFIPKPGQ